MYKKNISRAVEAAHWTQTIKAAGKTTAATNAHILYHGAAA